MNNFRSNKIKEKHMVFLCSSFNPEKNLIANYLNFFGKNIYSQLRQFEIFILMSDFNVEPNYANMKNFCQIYDCKNIVKDKTCFKNSINTTCIDFIITNRPKSKLSFYKMSLTVMKVFYNKQKTKNYSIFNYSIFQV